MVQALTREQDQQEIGDPDGNGAHGLNEQMRVSSVYKGRDFLYEVVKAYANQE